MDLLTFRDKNILYKRIDGCIWIAVKPVCEALNVNYNRQFQQLKAHPIFGAVSALQRMQKPGSQARKMICLPEEYIYGWLFSINSDSEELIAYQRECIQHFYETIKRREELYHQFAKCKKEIAELDNKLKDNEDFQRREAVKMQVARLWKNIKETSDDEQELFS